MANQEKRSREGNFSDGEKESTARAVTIRTAVDGGHGPEHGPGAVVAIRLLGPFEVRLGGVPLTGDWPRSGQWLLALLALRQGSAVERRWLAGTLWPDSSERL